MAVPVNLVKDNGGLVKVNGGRNGQKVNKFKKKNNNNEKKKPNQKQQPNIKQPPQQKRKHEKQSKNTNCNGIEFLSIMLGKCSKDCKTTRPLAKAHGKCK